MKFFIKTASGKEPPYDNANIEVWKTEVVTGYSEAGNYLGNFSTFANKHNWTDRGINHREENGMPVRDLEGWVVDIKDLDDLLYLSKVTNALVVEFARYERTLPSITIYDDFLE